MKESVKQEVKELIKHYNLNCSINEFKDKVDWNWISFYQKLSESFIYEFRNKLNIENLINRKLITKKRLLEIEEFEKEHLKKISKRSYRFSIMDI